MTFRNAEAAQLASARLLGEAGASMVKVEGAGHVLDVIHALESREIPVCAHLGLTPQSVHKTDGYRMQGKTKSAAERLVADALAVQEAGASLLVLECVPAALAKRITAEVSIPTIGIGAGIACDGQVLVIYDMLGITAGKRPRFTRDFLADRGSIADAIRAYAKAVHRGEFPPGAFVLDGDGGVSDEPARADYSMARARTAHRFRADDGQPACGSLLVLAHAREHVDRVVASIFVNPTQFGPGEDFSRYPRTPLQDYEGLVAHGCDLLFEPALEELYPFGAAASTRIEIPTLSESLEGAMRPGHFTGVATVVAKLFNLVQPDIAVFGRKDYQQLLVIERMFADLRLPIKIVSAPIVREPSGLAMSSRNQYLSADERIRAAAIHAALDEMCAQFHTGEAIGEIEKAALERLRLSGLIADYATLRRAVDVRAVLGAERGNGSALDALVAARVGSTRLIDNLSCAAPPAV